MNRYHLVHTTEFQYDGPVSESYNEVRLRPIHDERQTCVSFRLTTNPDSRGTAYRDSFGNWVHQFNVLPEHRKLTVHAESVVLAHDVALPPTSGVSLADLDAHLEDAGEEFYDFLMTSEYVPHLPQLDPLVHAAEQTSGGTDAGFAQAAADLIHHQFRYVKGATHVHSSISDALSVGAGVCQDFAHMLLGVVRKRGLPARYVSGYLVPGDTLNGSVEEVIGGQASHAWAEIFLNGAGWVGFDPTLGKPVSLRHVRIAFGRDYGDVAPVRGVYRGHAGQRLAVDVRVRPVVNDGGLEQLSELDAGEAKLPDEEERPQQPQQQQQ